MAMPTADPRPSLRFRCGTCGAVFAVPVELAGRRAVCSRCRRRLVVPAALIAKRPARPRCRRLYLLAALVAGVAAAVALILFGPPAERSPTGFLLLEETFAAAAAALDRGSPEVMANAAEVALRTAASLEGEPGLGAAGRGALAALLRLEAEFLQAASFLQDRKRSAEQQLARYRGILWHPPAEKALWPLFLADAEAARREAGQRFKALREALHQAEVLHDRLLAAAQAAIASLEADGVDVAVPLEAVAERRRGIVDEAALFLAEAQSAGL